MDGPPPDDRSAMSLAYAWATRIIAVAITLIVPALVGAWIGQKFGTAWTIVLLIVGFMLGVTGAVFQLMQIAKDSKSFRPNGSPAGETKRKTNDSSF
jgi:nitrate/nitrite transporter NarK